MKVALFIGDDPISPLVSVAIFSFCSADSSELPVRRDNKGSGGADRGDSTTFPDAQHMLAASFRNFNA